MKLAKHRYNRYETLRAMEVSLMSGSGSFLFLLYQAFLVTADGGQPIRCKVEWVVHDKVVESTGYDYWSHLEAALAIALSPHAHQSGYRSRTVCYGDGSFV